MNKEVISYRFMIFLISLKKKFRFIKERFEKKRVILHFQIDEIHEKELKKFENFSKNTFSIRKEKDLWKFEEKFGKEVFFSNFIPQKNIISSFGTDKNRILCPNDLNLKVSQNFKFLKIKSKKEKNFEILLELI